MLIQQLMAQVSALYLDGAAFAREGEAVARRLWDQLLDRQLETVALHMDAVVKQMRLLGESHGVHDLIAGQAQLVQEYMEKTAEGLRAASALVMTAQTGLEGLVKAPRPRVVATIAAPESGPERVLG